MTDLAVNKTRMKRFLLFTLYFLPLIAFAQSKVVVDVASPKPSITIDGLNCAILNTIYTCVARTCTPVQIMAGDSVEFCTNNQIFLNNDTAFWMEWNFTGSNYTSAITNPYPTNTPFCYYPKWTTAGTYTVDIFYNGWMSAYPSGDCWGYGPSHWIVVVDVTGSTGIASQQENISCEVFPNPGNGIYELRISKPEAVNEMYLTDISGKEILVVQDKNKLDLTNYAAGIYFLNIISENGKTVKKIIRD
jgi:hypothetical protein